MNLLFFEEGKLIARDHKKETAKGATMYSASVAATTHGQHTGKEGEEKMHTTFTVAQTMLWYTML